MKHIRLCPLCNKELLYSCKSGLDYAQRQKEIAEYLNCQVIRVKV